MSNNKLLARSKELQIEVPEGATNKEISDLIKIAEHSQLKASLKEYDKVKDELQIAKKKIEDLSAQLETSQITSQKEKPVVYKSKNQTYEFNIKGFIFKGVKYEASEAVKNPTLMGELIEAKFNHLKQV